MLATAPLASWYVAVDRLSDRQLDHAANPAVTIDKTASAICPLICNRWPFSCCCSTAPSAIVLANSARACLTCSSNSSRASVPMAQSYRPSGRSGNFPFSRPPATMST